MKMLGWCGFSLHFAARPSIHVQNWHPNLSLEQYIRKVKDYSLSLLYSMFQGL